MPSVVSTSKNFSKILTSTLSLRLFPAFLCLQKHETFQLLSSPCNLHLYEVYARTSLPTKFHRCSFYFGFNRSVIITVDVRAALNLSVGYLNGTPGKNVLARTCDRGIQTECFSFALKQPPKQLPDSDTFCGFRGRNISTYHESLVPGIPTFERRCIMHAYRAWLAYTLAHAREI